MSGGVFNDLGPSIPGFIFDYPEVAPDSNGYRVVCANRDCCLSFRALRAVRDRLGRRRRPRRFGYWSVHSEFGLLRYLWHTPRKSDSRASFPRNRKSQFQTSYPLNPLLSSCPQAQTTPPKPPVTTEKPLELDAASVKPAIAPDGVVVSGEKTLARKGAGIPIPRNSGGPGPDDPDRIHYPPISLKALLKRD